MDTNESLWLNLDDYTFENSSSDGDHYSTYGSRTYRTVLILFESLLGLMLNSLSFAAIYRGRYIAKDARIQLLNVVISDLLFSFIVIFSEHVGNTAIEISTALLCKFIWFCMQGIIFSTVMWRMALGIERLALISISSQVLGYSKNIKVAVLVGIWILSFLIPIYYTINATVYSWTNADGHEYSECHLRSYSTAWIHSLVQITPPIVIIIVYCVIARKLYVSSSYSQLSQQDNLPSAETKQTIYMLGADAVVFLLTWLPVHIATAMVTSPWFQYVLLQRHTGFTNYWDMIFTILHLILLIKCFDTPIIYYLTSSAFRSDAQLLFQSCCQRRNHENGDTIAVVRGADNEFHMAQEAQQ